MSITAKELAKLLKLSEAAVSMALNNKPGVSKKTRTRIIEAAGKNGYDFTRINETNTTCGNIHFVIYKKHGAVVADTPFFAQLTEGIDIGCKRAKYNLNINYIYRGDDTELQLGEILRSGSSGIILLGTEMDKEDFVPFSDIKIPLVLIDTYFESAGRDCILINNVEGAFQATSYIISKKKTQPGYLHSSYPIRNFEERADGFYKAVRMYGMSSSKSVVHKLSPSVEGAYADMLTLLKQGEEPASCYFADNDLIAAGAIKAFREMGYKIPEDVAVIGFDNMPICSYVEPAITTVNVPKQYIGEIAVQRLTDIISSKEFFPVKIEVSTNLAIRKSV